MEGLMLKTKLQHFGHLDSLEKTLMLGKTEGKRRRGWQRVRWSDGITDAMDMNLGTQGDGEGQEGLMCCTMGSQRVGHGSGTEQQQGRDREPGNPGGEARLLHYPQN